jgi:hypothetical protein
MRGPVSRTYALIARVSRAPERAAFVRADDETRTHDLLHSNRGGGVGPRDVQPGMVMSFLSIRLLGLGNARGCKKRGRTVQEHPHQLGASGDERGGRPAREGGSRRLWLVVAMLRAAPFGLGRRAQIA